MPRTICQSGRRKILLSAATLCCSLLFLQPVSAALAATPRPVVLEIPLHTTIQPISASYLERGLRRAAQMGCAAVVIEMGTPGGLLTSTRVMVSAIEASPVPVIVYVAPSGSRAGSAGFFLLEAADIAAMAPGTNAGASHPILEGTTMDPVLKQKLENDTSAFLRSYVSRRGRNVPAAEDAVLHSKSYTDQEALQLHLIDVIAPNVDALLQQLNGRQITRFSGSTTTLHFENARIDHFAPSVRERILGALTDPNLSVLLLILGGLLIYMEFNAPGTIIPGTLGTLLVLLALFALNLLPLEHAGVALMIAAVVLFVLDIKFATHGILGLAGTACLIFGLLTLVDGPIPEMRVALGTAIGAGAGFGILTIFLTTIALRARRNKVTTGGDALLGEVAVAQTALDPMGQVLVRGELWQAHALAGAQPGDRLRIVSRNGLLLEVERDQQGS
jgi:membrane-bound serine protease (ClpP class)